jgi:lipoprotein-anchoring transpeptidase ErfK/SrfK
LFKPHRLGGGGQEWGGSKQTVSFDPKYTAGQVIVSFGDRRLYLITKAGTAISYPVAVPREVDRWQGTTSVTDKRVNPSWRPTPEMLRENPRLPSWVPGGHPMNPLGVRALYLGSSTYRIHGTDAPWTIGTEASKGCIRMYNRDVLDLYPRVPVGTKVTVTWERFEGGGYAYSDEPRSSRRAYQTRLREMRSPEHPQDAVERWSD